MEKIAFLCFLWTSLGQNHTLNFMNGTRKCENHRTSFNAPKCPLFVLKSHEARSSGHYLCSGTTCVCVCCVWILADWLFDVVGLVFYFSCPVQFYSQGVSRAIEPSSRLLSCLVGTPPCPVGCSAFDPKSNVGRGKTFDLKSV